jgi:phosphohistidine phosphatase
VTRPVRAVDTGRVTDDDTTPRRLVVMRHAKAEPTGESDLARVLTSGGRDDAAEAGRWLAAQGVEPQHALVSSAERTRETWEAVRAGGGWDLEAHLDTGLYAAGPDAALDLIREVPAAAGTVVVIGHNPTMAFLAQLLDDGAGDPGIAVEMAGGFPTCALTVFEYAGAWATLDQGRATAVGFHVARA